jgi:hypothetical protein
MPVPSPAPSPAPCAARPLAILVTFASLLLAVASSWTSAAAAASRVAVLALGSEARVVTPEERRDFYRTAGKELLDRPLHLHVEMEVLRGARRDYTDQAGTKWIRFENRGVPLLIRARSPYWLQLQRHLDGAEELCLHGRVRLVPGDERQRACVEVTKLVRGPGSWR